MITLLMLAGCVGADLSGFVPTVTFSRFDVNAVDFEHIDVDFVFAVDNPNPVGIPLNRFDYALELAGVEIITGNDPNGLQLVADGASDIALPVSLTFASIFELVEATRGIDTLPFALRGGFGWDTDIGPVDVAYDEGGEFPALRTPKIELGQLRLAEVTAAGAALNLDLAVDNDHGSALGFDNLDFDLSVGGVRVGGGAVAELGEVPGAETRTLSVPIALDYADALSAIAAATSGDPVRVDFGADVDVDTPFGLVPLQIDERGNVEVRSE
jgi:LEA14-like dessication related protein